MLSRIIYFRPPRSTAHILHVRMLDVIWRDIAYAIEAPYGSSRAFTVVPVSKQQVFDTDGRNGASVDYIKNALQDLLKEGHAEDKKARMTEEDIRLRMVDFQVCHIIVWKIALLSHVRG